MPSEHSPADDIVFDLVSIQYHALKGAEAYDKYAEDAHDHEDVRQFIEECARQDAERAMRCHQLLGQLTSAHSLGGS
jgi:hypothetical protein